MIKLIIFSLTVFILSCATAPQTQILDDGFISSRPNFQVQFHKPIVEKSEKSRRVQRGDIKIYTFDVNYREGIVIAISTFIPDRSGFFLYGPKQVLTNWGRIALDPVVIDGRQWIKRIWEILVQLKLFRFPEFTIQVIENTGIILELWQREQLFVENDSVGGPAPNHIGIR